MADMRFIIAQAPLPRLLRVLLENMPAGVTACVETLPAKMTGRRPEVCILDDLIAEDDDA